jgi:hypothetical protein
MKLATWPREHDVQGWKCNNAECGEWRDFGDAFEGESHDCAVEPYECERCGGKAWVRLPLPTIEQGWTELPCPAGCDNGKVPARGVFKEACG